MNSWLNSALVLSLLVFGSAVAQGDEPKPLVMLDTNVTQFSVGDFSRDNKKQPAGTVETVDGKFGKAQKITFVDNALAGFMIGRIRPTETWDASDGFSFWVKGDGSKNWGGMELIDRDDFGKRYGVCFPIDSTDWRKIEIPWRDVIPELAAPLVNPKGGYPPSGFGNLFLGKWFYWREAPAESYTVEQFAIEPHLQLPPTPAAPAEGGLNRVRAKLGKHEPITIVAMGDSLTDTHHWSNRPESWPEVLAASLHAKYGSEIEIVNPAIGGTTLSQNEILMPRWSTEAPSPDLVTVLFGGNDWDTGVRGERFAEYLRLCVDRIRRQTNGSADVLLLTTCPGHDRWDTYKELEKAVKDVAAEKKTALSDLASEFRKQAGNPEEGLKQEYWAWDKVHLGHKGHLLVAGEVEKSIAESH